MFRRDIDTTASSVWSELRPGIELRLHPRLLVPKVTKGIDAEYDAEMESFVRLTTGCASLLDAGAQYGVFSLAFASRPGSVAFAVEPSRPAYQTLLYHARENPDCDVRPLPLALSDHCGVLEMEYFGEHLMGARGGGGWFRDRETIAMTTVDELADRHGVCFDAMKIDVEGFELHVLRGAEKSIRQNDPLVFLEVHPDYLVRYGTSVDELVAYLEKLGLGFYDLKLEPIAKPADLLNSPSTGRRTRGGFIRHVICAQDSRRAKCVEEQATARCGGSGASRREIA
jgi:FkbM family methyltransferase